MERIFFNKKEYKTIHSHTLDLDLIESSGWALDLGCNDFIMSRHLINLGLKVIGVDPIKNIQIPQDLLENKNFIFLENACVGLKKYNTKTYYEYSHFGANSIYNNPEMLHSLNNGHADNPLKTSYDVALITIEDIMSTYNISQFEYIKIDVEGAEYEILENFPKNCAKQFSVEFHDFLNLTPIKDVELYHKQLCEILIDYVKVYEEREPLSSNPIHFQRNDTLYILKTLL